MIRYLALALLALTALLTDCPALKVPSASASANGFIYRVIYLNRGRWVQEDFSDLRTANIRADVLRRIHFGLVHIVTLRR